MAYKESKRLPLKEMEKFQDMMAAGVAYRPGDKPVSVREFLAQQTGSPDLSNFRRPT